MNSLDGPYQSGGLTSSRIPVTTGKTLPMMNAPQVQMGYQQQYMLMPQSNYSFPLILF